MKLLDWLQVGDFLGLTVVVWVENDENAPLWSGKYFDIPYWVADMELADSTGFDADDVPISYRDSLGEAYNNRPGLVIVVKDK